MSDIRSFSLRIADPFERDSQRASRQADVVDSDKLIGKVTTRLPLELQKEFKAECKKDHHSPSLVIRDLILAWLVERRSGSPWGPQRAELNDRGSKRK